MQIVDGEGRASCRSIEEFDITALLRRNADLFLRFGGHRAAAGFSIDAARLEEVRDRLIADAAERLDGAAAEGVPSGQVPGLQDRRHQRACPRAESIGGDDTGARGAPFGALAPDGLVADG